MDADVKRMRRNLVTWIREQVREAGARGVVVGLSGGVDSSVVAALGREAFPDACIGVWMPCYSQEVDARHAAAVAETFKIPFLTVELEEAWDGLTTRLHRALNSLRETQGSPAIAADDLRMADANVKPRLRAVVLAHLARAMGYLILGTGNKSELTVGYFTKGGDSAVDLLPLGDLTKTQVWELARELGVPKEIVEKAPSAGLWQGQTDEGEMGITYAELDRYITTGEADPAVKERIERLHAASAHKRSLPPIPSLDSLLQ